MNRASYDGRAPANAHIRADWAAIAEAACVVARLAGEADPGDLRLPEGPMRDCAWRGELVRHSIADLAAILEHGLRMLLAIKARRGDARPAAAALWREFCQGREAISALLSPGPDSRTVEAAASRAA